MKSGLIKGCFNDERGIVLPIVVVFIAVIILLGATSAFMMESQTQMGARFATGVDALHYAEAGANKYLWHLNEDTVDSAPLDTTVAFDEGYYRLRELDASDSLVTVRSTGWLAADPSSRRTIDVTMRKRQFNQYVYLSNNDGDNIWWIKDDKCYGPYHTNGTLRVQYPVFYGRASYSTGIEYHDDVIDPSDPAYQSQTFRQGRRSVTPLTFPASNQQLRSFAQNDGHYYTGRTSIFLHDDGIMIRNQDGERKGPLNIPRNGVIYVDVGAKGATGKFNTDSGNAFVSGTLNGKLTIAAANDIYITGWDPTKYNFDEADETNGISYGNTTFPDITEGGEKIGVGAEGDDMLGLVANNNVWILGRGWFDNSSWPRDSAPTDITIHAALFAINGSFGYERYRDYKKGVINHVGAIVQSERGAVGTFGREKTGYEKNYAHDPRMDYNTPPHFLEPATAGWDVLRWTETSAHLATE